MRASFHTLLLPVVLSLSGLLAQRSQANNIQVTNASLTGNDGVAGYVFIQSDVSWQNSWRGGGVSNWDAAWVFVKYRTANGLWQHVRLSNIGHTAPAGSTMDLGLLSPGTAYNVTTNPVLGIFLRRNSDGSGTFTGTALQLRWDYALQGLLYNDITEVRVYAIEMVYAPQGAYAVGSGGIETAGFTLTTINTANTATDPTGTGSLGGQAGGHPSGIPWGGAAYPNGYNAFYCMKYELSQQGYVDFLNTLTYNQQAARTATAPTSNSGTPALATNALYRNGIDIQAPGVLGLVPALYACNLDGDATYGETTDGKDLACNEIGWADLAAYLDWSALRPMTELEYEKASRGPVVPVANAYPWGTAGIAGSAYTLNNQGTANEGIATNYSTTLGNASYFTTSASYFGILRVGVFAANAASTGRVTAGASFYGIMELAGNAYELVVNIQPEGGVYTGTHGNGALTAGGLADGATWPSYTTDAGMGLRGGAVGSGSPMLRISDRTNIQISVPGRGQSIGGRGVRSAL